MQILDNISEVQAPLLLNVTDARLHVTPEEFERLCQLNPDLRLEVNRDGELIAMAPTAGMTTIRAKLYHDRLKTVIQQHFQRSILQVVVNRFTMKAQFA